MQDSNLNFLVGLFVLVFFMFHEVICLCLHFFPRVHNVFVNGRSDRVRDKLLHKIV